MFTLYNIESATLLSERIKLSDGKRAARAARLLSLKTQQRFQPRKIEAGDNSAWHARERARFESGEYKRVIFGIEVLAQMYEEQYKVKLFAHVSTKNPELIAYTKDAIKGAQDKQSVMSAASFIDFVSPNNADKNILVEEYLNANKIHTFLLATTPDDIEKVYTNYCPDSRQVAISCMHYDARHFESRVDGAPYHPVRIYGAGDLAIAYQTNGEGQTTARALCWPDQKIYSRMYADNDSLHKALQAAGYSKSSYYGCANPRLEGARLNLVYSDDGDIVAPYLDEIGTVALGTSNLIIDSDGEYQCQNTNGLLNQNNRQVCDSCENDVSADELRDVYMNARQSSSRAWCEYCRDNYGFYCEGTDEWYSENVDYTIINDSHYTTRYVEEHANYCDYYEEYMFSGTYEVTVNSNGETQNWSDVAIEGNTFDYNGRHYSDVLDSVNVVTERYVLQTKRLWRSDNSSYQTINAWYRDIVETIPQYLIDDGVVEIVEHNGRYYLKDYVDHYPVARERFDVPSTPVLDSLVAELDSLAA